MEIINKSQAHQQQNEATQMEKERFNKDISLQIGKIQRAQQQFQSNYNNVRAVKGDGFDESVENMEVMAQVEGQKTESLLNALSVIVNEFPALGTVIRGSFGDDLQIPSRPQSAIERPITGSGSNNSN